MKRKLLSLLLALVIVSFLLGMFVLFINYPWTAALAGCLVAILFVAMMIDDYFEEIEWRKEK